MNYLEEKVASLEDSVRRLEDGRERDKKVIKNLQEKLNNREYKDTSTKRCDQTEGRPQHNEEGGQWTDKYEKKVVVHSERLTDLNRHLQITESRVDQHGVRLNNLEQRADHQDERIDDLQPLAGRYN